MFSRVKVYYFLIGFFCFIVNIVSGQDQKLADSLFRTSQRCRDIPSLACCAMPFPGTNIGREHGVVHRRQRTMTHSLWAAAATVWRAPITWLAITVWVASPSLRKAGSAAATPRAIRPSFAQTICANPVFAFKKPTCDCGAT